MEKLIGIAAAVGLIAAIGFGTGMADLVVPEEPTEHEVELAAIHTQFSFPIPYSATVTQSGDGIAEPRTRFYVANSVKGAQ